MASTIPLISRRRSRCKQLLIIGASLLFASVWIGGSLFVGWLFGWKAFEMRFHKSWDEQQREELAMLGHTVCFDLLITHPVKNSDDDFLTLQELDEEKEIDTFFDGLRYACTYCYTYLRAAISARDEHAELYRMLREVAASGRAESHTKSGMTAAHLAAHSNMLDLLRELVLRGADPNAIQTSGLRPESVFQTAIACVPLREDAVERASQTERFHMLAWLLEHGADMNSDSSYTLLLGTLADAYDKWQEDATSIPGATVEWLLEHGLRVESQIELCTVFAMLPDPLPVWQHFAEKGYLDMKDPAVLSCMLNLVSSSHFDENTPQAVQWILSLGADPNAPDSRPLQNCCEKLCEYASPEEGDHETLFSAALQMLDLLLRHGAVWPEHPAEHGIALPAAAAFRSRCAAILQRYNIAID